MEEEEQVVAAVADVALEIRAIARWVWFGFFFFFFFFLEDELSKTMEG